jgi:hypothetical protein
MKQTSGPARKPAEAAPEDGPSLGRKRPIRDEMQRGDAIAMLQCGNQHGAPRFLGLVAEQARWKAGLFPYGGSGMCSAHNFAASHWTSVTEPVLFHRYAEASRAPIHDKRHGR